MLTQRGEVPSSSVQVHCKKVEGDNKYKVAVKELSDVLLKLMDAGVITAASFDIDQPLGKSPRNDCSYKCFAVLLLWQSADPIFSGPARP
jgi:hypothetical protein